MKLKDLFEKGFRRQLLHRLVSVFIRLSKIFVILLVVSYFYYVGITPTESMMPTIQTGDLIVFERNVRDLKRGDIVNFYFPAEDTVYLKRIIGLPGEIVEVKDGFVYVNGYPLEEDYILEQPSYEMEELLIPADSYFMLGDNRNNSYDSSAWGVIEGDLIRGRVRQILLPAKRNQLFVR